MEAGNRACAYKLRYQFLYIPWCTMEGSRRNYWLGRRKSRVRVINWDNNFCIYLGVPWRGRRESCERVINRDTKFCVYLGTVGITLNYWLGRRESRVRVINWDTVLCKYLGSTGVTLNYWLAARNRDAGNFFLEMKIWIWKSNVRVKVFLLDGNLGHVARAWRKKWLLGENLSVLWLLFKEWNVK